MVADNSDNRAVDSEARHPLPGSRRVGGGSAQPPHLWPGGLTSLTLSCAATAYVFASSGTVTADATVSIRADSVCNQRDATMRVFGLGGSAAGPKPGSDSFSVELRAANLNELIDLVLGRRFA
jgi:hypothetical protein